MKSQPKSAAPKSAPPISRDIVEIVKKKIAPPMGPPPPGMNINFTAPKIYKKSAQRKYDDDDDRDYYSDEDNLYHVQEDDEGVEEVNGVSEENRSDEYETGKIFKRRY